MEIIFEGKYTNEEAVEHLSSMIRLFKERYNIRNFREMHLSVSLVDSAGQEVELVDSETAEAYRVIEVHRESKMVKKKSRPRASKRLALVVDNTIRVR